MKVGCAALYPITRYGFPYSFDNYIKALDEMQAAGFDAVELEVNVDLDLDEYRERIQEVQRKLNSLELRLSAVIIVVQQAFSTDRAAADEHVRRFDLASQFIADAGCDTTCICAYMPKEIERVAGTEVYAGSPPTQIRVPPGFDWQAFWDNAVARFRQMAQIAAGRGQRLVIENRVGDFVNTSDGALKATGNAPGESLPEDVRVAAQRFPDAMFLMAHRGGDWQYGKKAARRMDNLYVDIGSPHEMGIVELILLDGRIGIAGEPYRNMRSEAPRGSHVDCVNLWLPEA